MGRLVLPKPTQTQNSGARGANRRSAHPPVENTPAAVHPPAEVAGGIKAVTIALGFTLGEVGVVRGVETLARLNQFRGFDCPGCAWPDPDDRRALNEYCENGAKAIAEEATSKRIITDFFRRYSLSELSAQSDYWLGHQGRLTEPMLLREAADRYEPVPWDAAFTLIARQLNALAHPGQAIFYTSGRTSNEAAFLYQLFVREFGTNNLPDCSNLCHESSGAALTPVIGVGKGTVTLSDFDLADTIFIIGQNPGTNHPRMLTTLEKAARRGATIISVNPLSEAGVTRFKHPQDVLRLFGAGTKIASHFVRVRLSGDLAFLKGLCKDLLELESANPGTVLRTEFISHRTHKFEAFRESLEAISWEDVVEQSGIPREQIREIAQIVAHSRNLISCWAMGLTQQREAVATIQEIVNLHLLGGHLGRPGAGLCPVRGHSNVQGDRTMGIWERPPSALLDKLRDTFGFEPPRNHGYDVVDSIKAMHRGDAKVFFAMGGNFLSATPDTEFTAQALANCNLTVHVSTKLNRSHLITGKQALILPCLGRTDRDTQSTGDQFVSVENSMGIVHSSLGKLRPPSVRLLSEPAIVARLAVATLGARSKISWLALIEDYDRIRDLIAKVIPGCEDYNRRVRLKSGFYLSNPARDSLFHTQTGKAHFSVSPLVPIRLEPGEFLLTTIRSHDQFNTTIYGLDDRYRGITGGRRVVFLNPDDIAEHGWRPGQHLDITSHFTQGTALAVPQAGDNSRASASEVSLRDAVPTNAAPAAHPAPEQLRTARHFQIVPYDIPRRCAATYFPEANVLVPINSVAKISNTPTSKSLRVTFSLSSP